MNIVIFFEAHMEQRFSHLVESEEYVCFCYKLNNSSPKAMVYDLIDKIKGLGEFKEKYQEMLFVIDNNNISNVYFSTAEGYLAHNVIHWLKRDRPKMKTTAMQHGLFVLNHSLIKRNIRKIINFTFFKMFMFYPWGVGFGSKLTNEYIVYNDKIKNYLVRENGWNVLDVFSDISFLKKNLYTKSLDFEVKKESGSALFLLQGFYEAGLCSKSLECLIFLEALSFIKKRHKNVYVKKHPASSSATISGNDIHFIEDLEYGFAKCEYAYSFFSTALLDAQLCGLDAVALYHPRMRELKYFNKLIYNNFDKVIDIHD